MNSVKFGADILPSDAYQNITFEIDYANGNVSKLIEIIHEGLDCLGIYDLGKPQVRHLPKFTFPKFFFKFFLVTYIESINAVSYTHLRAHETDSYLVCRLLLEKKKTIYQ